MARNTTFLAYKEKCKLLETTKSPRIIFVSGSNLAMGLDSKRISDSLGINVVNDALTIQLGLRFMIDDVALYLRKGDILVIAPEYQHFYTLADADPSGMLTRVMEVASWKKWKILNSNQRKNVIVGFYGPIKDKNEHLWRKRDSNLNVFNEYGDEVGHWNKDGYPAAFNKPGKVSFDEKFAKYFCYRVEELSKKVKVIIMPPVIIEPGYESYKDMIKEVSARLKEYGHPFIVEPKEHSFRNEYYYDHPYHPTKNGVDIFTGKVIEELRPYVDEKKGAL
jgi:hypothetical protein